MLVDLDDGHILGEVCVRPRTNPISSPNVSR